MERGEIRPKRLTREQKIINSLSDLGKDGVLYATPDQILERVRKLYLSRLNIPFLPLWDRAIDNLRKSEQIVAHPFEDEKLTLG